MTISGDRDARHDHGPALRAYLNDLASSAAVPGGGSAAAIGAAHAAALVAMVGRLTVGRDAFSEFENETAPALAEADRLVYALHSQIAADEAAFDAVMGAYRRPRDTPEARRLRRQAISEASRLATVPPLEVARLARRVVDLAFVMARRGNPMVISDAAVAAWSAIAAIRASIMNVRVNLGATNDPTYSSTCEREIASLLANTDQIASDSDALVLSRIGYAPIPL
ncbi:MAG: methenyltetrahydrofolate cyclohydrolase [Chloroflexi bacterium]|nr:methenyltetrahydrofolate cyclohydrolase [Chloroflexota bacterium]